MIASILLANVVLISGLGHPQDDVVYVPRTEVRSHSELVPRVVYDRVDVQETVTVYDRYRSVLVPDGSVGPFVSPLTNRVYSPVVGRFKWKTRSVFKGRFR